MSWILSAEGQAHLKREKTIEAVILEQLESYRDELTSSQRKLIAHQCAREAARRISESE